MQPIVMEIIAGGISKTILLCAYSYSLRSPSLIALLFIN